GNRSDRVGGADAQRFRRKSCNSSERHEDLGNLLGSAYQAQGLDDVGDLAVDGRVEDSIPAADHGLVIAPGVPGKRRAWSKVVLRRFEIPILAVYFVTQPEG